MPALALCALAVAMPLTASAQDASLVFRLDDGFDIPESMQHDPVRDVYYVSNIGGHATRADNSGYITRILPDGRVDRERFIAGGRDGVTLNAPKGMLVERDTLWVADVDRVRAFHLGTGRPLTTVDLSAAGARFLNDLDRGPERLDPELVADGLEVPWDMAFAPDGRIFVTERPGRVRIVDPVQGLMPRAWTAFDVAEGGDGGLQGIALDPAFEQNGYVYVMGTFPTDDGSQESRIIRLTEVEGRAVDPVTIFGPIAMPGVHRGGGLDFGPDGLLYASVGESRALDAPQDPTNVRGSIVRLNPDGTTPDDPVFPDSPVFAIGLRNPQGLDFDAAGTLFATEHGPSDFPGEQGWTGRDEVNAILPGANYGWPRVAGDTTVTGFVRPLAAWTPAIAPGGLAVQTIDGQPGPVLWVSGLRGERLVRLALRADAGQAGWRVDRARSYLQSRLGRIRAVGLGPDGHLYVTTSNRDADGASEAPLDGLYRIRIQG